MADRLKSAAIASGDLKIHSAGVVSWVCCEIHGRPGTFSFISRRLKSAAIHSAGLCLGFVVKFMGGLSKVLMNFTGLLDSKVLQNEFPYASAYGWAIASGDPKIHSAGLCLGFVVKFIGGLSEKLHEFQRLACLRGLAE